MIRHDYRAAKRHRWSYYMVRCKHCGHRQTFGRHPDFHRRLPRCCGAKDWRIDWYRTSRLETKRYTCKCDDLPWPHRKGSHYEMIKGEPFRCRAKARA